MSDDPLIFRREFGALRPASAAAIERVENMAQGEEVQADLKGFRANTRRNALYWSIATVAAEHWPMDQGQMTRRHLHAETMKFLGYAKEAGRTRAGNIVMERESMSFAKMQEPVRAQYINEAFDFWSNEIGCDVQTLLNEAKSRGMAA